MSRYRIRDRADGTYAVACVWDGPQGPRAGIRWQPERPEPVSRAEARRMMAIARSYLGFMAREIVYCKVFGFVLRDPKFPNVYLGARGWSRGKHAVGRADARKMAEQNNGCTIVRVAL